MKAFPSNFLWGAAIASYQVEGNITCQWSEWEKANAPRLASEYIRRFSNAPNFEKFLPEGENPDNYICGPAIDHLHRYQSDFDLLVKLGINSFRFSIEWARIEPKKGRFDREAIEWYRNYIRELKKRGLTPIVTLWHFTFPTWFRDLGGFEHHGNIKYFEQYVRRIVTELKDDLDIIITINEPIVYTLMSYIIGDWPPQKKGFLRALHIINNLASAHNSAYKIIKKINPSFRVSFAKNKSHVQPLNHNTLNHVSVRLQNYIRDDYFFDRTRRHLDFIAINWYQSDSFDATFIQTTQPRRINDLGWNMNPADIEFSMYRLYRRYQLPIIITENGLADEADENRIWWIRETITGMRRAIARGVPIFGYMHWSAFDNFEWDKGFWPRFGLIAVDYQNNLKRTLRPSAKWYADFIDRQTRTAPKTRSPREF